jgi:ABC-type lipoprotein release transport system permease subunit
MAWKNLFRYKKRSIITASAIGAGVMLTVFFAGLLYGMQFETERNLRWNETASAKVFASGYFAERDAYPLDYLIEKDEQEAVAAVIDAAAAKTGIRVAQTPRVLISAEAYFDVNSEITASTAVLLAGVRAAGDESVFRIKENVDRGRWLSAGGEGVVIGNSLASDMNAELGDTVVIECHGPGGFLQAMEAPITGIVVTGDNIINSGWVFMDLEYLDAQLELEGSITELDIAVPETANFEKTTAALRAALSSMTNNFEFYTWRELSEDILALIRTKNSGSGIFLFCVLIVAAVGVVNTMLMAVMERKNEIAMLLALGCAKGAIRALFLLEGLFIGLIGSAAGFIAGAAVNLFFAVHGLDISAAFQGVDMGYRSAGVLRSAWDFKIMGSCAIGAALVSALAAFFPSGKIVKKEIAEIFRSV